MKITPIGIEGAWQLEAPVYPDDRGVFREWFISDLSETSDLPLFQVKQANTSLSNKGVIRGIHFSDADTGQSKIVTCTSGSGLDVIVDLRANSRTFGRSVSIELSAGSGISIFISSGLGHAFQAFDDKTALTYLLNKKYDPKAEFAVNPLDVQLSISWKNIPKIISDRDLSAPGLTSILQGKK